MRTLDIEQLAESDIVDLSGVGRAALTVPPLSDGTLSKSYKIEFGSHNYIEHRFPANTVGCFYFHKPADSSSTPFTWSVRFRNLSSAFSPHNGLWSREMLMQGEDLRDPRGEIWCTTLLQIVSSPSYGALVPVLLADKLICQDDITSVRAASPKLRGKGLPKVRVVSFVTVLSLTPVLAQDFGNSRPHSCSPLETG